MRRVKRVLSWFVLCLVVLLGLLLERVHHLLRWWSYVSFHQVVIDGADFHEEEISLLKLIWLTCNLVPLRGFYQPLQRVERGLYVVDGRLNRVSFESNFINQIKSEDL